MKNGLALLGIAAVGAYLYLNNANAAQGQQAGGGTGDGLLSGGGTSPTSGFNLNFANPFPDAQALEATPESKKAASAARLSGNYADNTLYIPANFQALKDSAGMVIGFASPEGQSYDTRGANIVYGNELSNVHISGAGAVVGVTDSKKLQSYAVSPTTLSNIQSGGGSYATTGAPISGGKKAATSTAGSAAPVSNPYFVPQAQGAGAVSSYFSVPAPRTTTTTSAPATTAQAVAQSVAAQNNVNASRIARGLY